MMHSKRTFLDLIRAQVGLKAKGHIEGKLPIKATRVFIGVNIGLCSSGCALSCFRLPTWPLKKLMDASNANFW